MEDKKIPISNDILEELDKSIMATSILNKLKAKIK